MLSSVLSRLSDVQFRGLVVAINVVLIIFVMRLRFCYEPVLPPKPAKPKAVSIADAKATSMRVDRNTEVYAQFLTRDSREHGLEPIPVKVMAKAIPYRQSRMRHLLVPGKKDSVHFAGLKLTVRAGKVPNSARTHMLLDIENTTESPMAYRVVTRPSKGVRPCHKKKDLGHNAIAVAALGKETRTECIYRRSWGLEVERIEVMPLTELSYFYVSAVRPSTLGIDDRVSGGHLSAGGGKLCKSLLSSRTRRALHSGDLGWRDLVDFYSRHPCKTYDFPSDYRAWNEDSESPLPAVQGR